jgi:hypothetical protein
MADNTQYDTISNRKPDYPTLAALARAVGAVDGFARAPFGHSNPPVEMLSDLFGVPAIQRTMERASYGEPITQGHGMLLRSTPDTTDALLALAPAASKLGKLAIGAAKGVGKVADKIPRPAAPDWGDFDHDKVKAIAAQLQEEM